jgi:hypothetical protein
MAVEIRHFKQDYQSLKREVSRLASMANKRLVRLENNGFEDSPAYKQWIESGGEKFSVRGKDYNALQKELARVRQFVNAKTSTIRGAQSVLKAIAANTGANFKGKELWEQASNFFRVASMIEQYIRNTEDVASAIGYQKIWTAINQYTKANDIDLAAMQVDMEQMVGNIAQMIGIEATNTVVDPLADMLGGNYVVIK